MPYSTTSSASDYDTRSRERSHGELGRTKSTRRQPKGAFESAFGLCLSSFSSCAPSLRSSPSNKSNRSCGARMGSFLPFLFDAPSGSHSKRSCSRSCAWAEDAVSTDPGCSSPPASPAPSSEPSPRREIANQPNNIRASSVRDSEGRDSFTIENYHESTAQETEDYESESMPSECESEMARELMQQEIERIQRQHAIQRQNHQNERNQSDALDQEGDVLFSKRRPLQFVPRSLAQRTAIVDIWANHVHDRALEFFPDQFAVRFFIFVYTNCRKR